MTVATTSCQSAKIKALLCKGPFIYYVSKEGGVDQKFIFAYIVGGWVKPKFMVQLDHLHHPSPCYNYQNILMQKFEKRWYFDSSCFGRVGFKK